MVSYKSPFTYADAKKSNAYSSFVDMEDGEKEYEEAKQGILLRYDRTIQSVLLLMRTSSGSSAISSLPSPMSPLPSLSR